MNSGTWKKGNLTQNLGSNSQIFPVRVDTPILYIYPLLNTLLSFNIVSKGIIKL